jgi:hypothetical protein
VTDARTAALLQDIVRRESRSLLQYISESFPWTTTEERDALARIEKMVEEERRGATTLGRYLVRQRHTAPYLGPYPTDFTNINFVALEHWLPLLVGYERRAIADLERDLAGLSDAEARPLVQDILETKRRHLAALAALAAAHPAEASTVR